MVAKYLRCSVRGAIRLGAKNGAEFEKILNYARAELIAKEQLEKEARRG